MPRSLPLVRVIDALVEFGWLFLIVAVPTFFNVNDERTFEPDKIVVIRNVVLLLVLLVLIKTVYRAPQLLRRRAERRAAEIPSGEVAAATSPLGMLRSFLLRWPLIAAMTLFMLVYLAATLNSIIPSISFWGSYDRMEGYYTYLNYAVLMLLIAIHLRTRAQAERLVTAVIAASVPAATYSWIQHFSIDPLIWGTGNQTAVRTPSTLGNPIFLAAFMLMTTPLTLHRIIHRVRRLLSRPGGWTDPDSMWLAIGTAGYGAALILQVLAVVFSSSRGPGLGFLAALAVFGLTMAIKTHAKVLLGIAVGFLVLVVGVLGAANTVDRTSAMPSGGLSRFLYLVPSQSDSSEVRALLWRTSFTLAKAHPLLGCGPEVLLFCWYPDYPAALRNIESANAAPDRSHNEEIDVLLMSGVLGEASYLLMIGVGVGIMALLVRQARDLWSATFAAALLATYVGHIAEAFTGIAFSATLLLFWITMGAASALWGGPLSGLAGLYAPQGAEIPEDQPRAVEQPVSARAMKGQNRRTPARGGNDRSARGARPAQHAPGYSFGQTLSRLGAGPQALVAGAAVATVAIAVGCAFLFVYNINLILADVEYRIGLNFEQTATQYTSTSIATQASQAGTTGSQSLQEYNQGLSYFQYAIQHYANAVNIEGNQDTYFLFLGKTYLEYADALNRDPQHNATHDEVSQQVEQALSVFKRAEANNPLNPDHPRNVAKLYNYWGAQAFGPPVDVAKLTLGDQSFALAHHLAPHNADILDEWAILDIELGTYDTAHAHTWYADARAHLELAISLYPQFGTGYRDLADVDEQYGLWAESAKNSAQARQYYLQAADAFERALGVIPGYAAATNSQSIYPRLATLYATKLNNVCQAGQYALDTLNAIKQAQLSAQDSTTAVQQTMQQWIAHAQSDKSCHLVQP